MNFCQTEIAHLCKANTEDMERCQFYRHAPYRVVCHWFNAGHCTCGQAKHLAGPFVPPDEEEAQP